MKGPSLHVDMNKAFVQLRGCKKSIIHVLYSLQSAHKAHHPPYSLSLDSVAARELRKEITLLMNTDKVSRLK
jgi:hypothetical protein